MKTALTFGACLVVLALALAGCTSLNNMAKPQVCVQNQDGTYTGEPKPAAVAATAALVQAAATKVGYSLDSATATTIATVALSKYCDGTIEDVASDIYEQLSGILGKKAAMEIVVRCCKQK